MTTSPTPLQRYEIIADITGRMLNHARGSEWEQVIALSEEYIQAVASLKQINAQTEGDLPAAGTDADNEAMQVLLTRIIEEDAEIRELATPELQRLGHLLGDTKRHKDVVQAYCAPSMNE